MLAVNHGAAGLCLGVPLEGRQLAFVGFGVVFITCWQMTGPSCRSGRGRRVGAPLDVAARLVQRAGAGTAVGAVPAAGVPARSLWRYGRGGRLLQAVEDEG